MKKSVVALFITSALSSTTSFAQTNETENIIVTASRSAQDKFDALASVEVIDRADIEQLQPDSIAELLTRIAGVTSSTQGGAGHQTSLFFRGTNSDHVLVLLNGVRVGSATLGSKEFATIPVALVERVEVVKGPRAALWGSDALGGVIQIFTRQLDNGEGQVGVSMGHDGYWQGYAAIGFGNEKHNYTLSAFTERADGYDVIEPDPANIYAVDQPDEDGFDRQSVSLVGLSQFSDLFSLEVNAQLDKGNTEIDASFGGDEFDHDNYHFLVRGHWDTEKSHYQLSYAQSVDNNEDNNSDLFEGAINSLFETKRNQLTGIAQTQVSDTQEVTVGVEWYDEEITSATQYSDNKRDASAIFVTARQEYNQWKFEQAVRYDNVGDTDSETTFQLSVGYQLTPNWLVALSHGTAFKAPSFNDLYWPEAFGSAGNPDLVSETSRNSELLARYQENNVEFEISAYQTEIDDLIEWAPLDATDPFSAWQPTNIAEAKIKGLDASGKVTFENFFHQASLSHIDAQNENTDTQLFSRAYFSANYSVGYQAEAFDVSINVNYQGSRPDSSGVKLDSFTVINLNANYRVNDALNLHAKVTNITDEDYELVYQYPGDGSGYRIGLDYNF